MNICFEYVYRDASNYKNWGAVILSNDQGVPLNEIESLVREALIEGEFFVAERVGVPTLYFDKFNFDVDHSWHQFSMLSWTEEEPNIALKISNFIKKLRSAKTSSIG